VPTFQKRTAAEVPQPSRVSRSVREQQQIYETSLSLPVVRLANLSLGQTRTSGQPRFGLLGLQRLWASSSRCGTRTAKSTSAAPRSEAGQRRPAPSPKVTMGDDMKEGRG
jgi:hypothetical protein